MMPLLYLFAFVAIFTSQTVLAPIIRIFGVAPDFVLLFVVYLALRRGALVGVFWGFLAGFTQDIYADPHLLGASALTLTVVGFVVGQMEEKFINLGLVAKVAILGVSFFVNDAIYGWMTGLTRDQVTDLFVNKSMPEGLYTLLIGTLVFQFLYPRSSRHVS